MDISGRDGHLACASVLNACPYPGKQSTNYFVLFNYRNNF